MTSPRFPEPPAAIPPTPISEVDAVVERVASKKAAWTATSIPERISLLELCLAGVQSAAADWVRDMCRVKGFSPDDNLAGEEWLAGPATTARNVRLLINALKANGAPKLPALSQRPNGQWVARVFPSDLKDKL